MKRPSTLAIIGLMRVRLRQGWLYCTIDSYVYIDWYPPLFQLIWYIALHSLKVWISCQCTFIIASKWNQNLTHFLHHNYISGHLKQLHTYMYGRWHTISNNIFISKLPKVLEGTGNVYAQNIGVHQICWVFM